MAGFGSLASTHAATVADDDFIFKKFKNLPLEVRSMIWLAAAEAAKPCGVYHFTYKKIVMRSGPQYLDLSDTVLANLHRLPEDHPLARDIHDLLLWSFSGESVLTFTPSAQTAVLTRAVRDVLMACPEARAEIMRSPELSTGINFHYLKDGKCNLGTIRPFYYDADWISMDGLDHDAAGSPGHPGLPNIHYTSDICRIQNLAFPYYDCAPHEFGVEGCSQLDIIRHLVGLKCVGYYQPSFCIKRVSHWENIIPQSDRLCLKGIPASMMPVPAAGPQLTGRKFRAAMWKIAELIRRFIELACLKTVDGWQHESCEFGALTFCLLIHADSKEGLDLMKFREDGSHLEGINWPEDLGYMGENMDWLISLA